MYYALLFIIFLLIPFAEADDYLVGIFGVPEKDQNIFRRVGFNSILIREKEIDKTRDLTLNKIYVLGVNPSRIKKGLDETELERLMLRYRQLNDAYGYYVIDDAKCPNKELVDNLINKLQITINPIVGLMKGKSITCFPEYSTTFYHYPLLRREVSLSEMLKQQVETVKKTDKKVFIYPQTHQQFWYKKMVKLCGMDNKALLYPDGQVVRMLIYYAIATGSNGYFLYNNQSLNGEISEERFLGAAQAVLETRPLCRAISNQRGVEFFKKAEVYGTVIKGDSYDIIFAFTGDVKSLYHPSIKTTQIELNELINKANYTSIYQYSPIIITPALKLIKVPQDHALVLIAFKDKEDIKPFTLNNSESMLYLQILQYRAKKLAQNIAMIDRTSPAIPDHQSNTFREENRILNYIDNLNEIKRNEWMKRATKLPIDGDILNRMYWKGKLKKPIRGQVFNFYYHDDAK